MCRQQFDFSKCLKTGITFFTDEQTTTNNMSDFLETEEKIVQMLRTVYDPEIPVNIYDLGLVYNIDVDEDGHVEIDMTLTAPNCPVADFIIEDVRMKVESIEGIKDVDVNIVYEPAWDKSMMSEEAKLELGLL